MIKTKIQVAAKVAAGWVPDALMASGAAAVAYGASMVYQPAGLIVGGCFLLAAGWLVARGSK